mgnify:CR=1 FL=1
MAFAECFNAFELIALEYTSTRIVGIAEEKDFGLFVDVFGL